MKNEGKALLSSGKHQHGKRILLHFAHRGEARVFLEELAVHPVSFPVKGLYENERFLVVISGEGRQNTTETLAAAISYAGMQISEVLNLGVAGSLHYDLKLNRIVSVRTVYGAIDNRVEFKTFTSVDDAAEIDCISTSRRILEKEDAEPLSYFAQIVDRELWACASVCKRFNIPFRSLKMISDRAGEQALCADIAEDALRYSHALFNHFKKLAHQEEPENERIELPDGFYATVAQKRQLTSLLQAVVVKEKRSAKHLPDFLPIDDILKSEKHPKKRTIRLIHELRDYLNPFRRRLEESLKPIFEPLRGNDIRVSPARDYETNALGISFTVENEDELDRKCAALKSFDYVAYREILSGEVMSVNGKSKPAKGEDSQAN